MYSIGFCAISDEFDAICLIPVESTLELARTVRAGGESWTVLANCESHRDADREARRHTKTNSNYKRGFGPRPVRFLGVVKPDDVL